MPLFYRSLGAFAQAQRIHWRCGANKQPELNRLSKSSNAMGKLGSAPVDPALSLDKSHEWLRRNLLL
jgi:hypothetical protein